MSNEQALKTAPPNHELLCLTTLSISRCHYPPIKLTPNKVFLVGRFRTVIVGGKSNALSPIPKVICRFDIMSCSACFSEKKRGTKLFHRVPTTSYERHHGARRATSIDKNITPTRNAVARNWIDPKCNSPRPWGRESIAGNLTRRSKHN